MTELLILLLAEVAYFAAAGRRFTTADNVANIVRHSVEIGLLALVAASLLVQLRTVRLEVRVGLRFF